MTFHDVMHSSNPVPREKMSKVHPAVLARELLFEVDLAPGTARRRAPILERLVAQGALGQDDSQVVVHAFELHGRLRLYDLRPDDVPDVEGVVDVVHIGCWIAIPFPRRPPEGGDTRLTAQLPSPSSNW